MAIKDWWGNLIAPAVRLWEKLIPIAWLRETLETVIWAVILALLLKTFVIQAFWIPSGSMIPTLKDPKIDYVKRLIALPGDKFEVHDGIVWINGQKIDEPYVKFHDTYNQDPIYVPEKSYIALGDNRPNSADSRYWGFVPEKNIRGPVIFRYWPLNRIGLVK